MEPLHPIWPPWGRRRANPPGRATAFKRAGLSHAQMQQAMDWYRDHVRPGMDEVKLAESFTEFAAAKNWPAEQRDAAVSVYGQVRDQGPAAVMSPAPSAEEDAATIARASELLR